MVRTITHSNTSQLACCIDGAMGPGIMLCRASKHGHDNDCENASATTPLNYGGWESKLLRGMRYLKILQNIRCLVKWSECRAIAKKHRIRSRLHLAFRPVRAVNQKFEIHLSEHFARVARRYRRPFFVQRCSKSSVPSSMEKR